MVISHRFRACIPFPTNHVLITATFFSARPLLCLLPLPASLSSSCFPLVVLHLLLFRDLPTLLLAAGTAHIGLLSLSFAVLFRLCIPSTCALGSAPFQAGVRSGSVIAGRSTKVVECETLCGRLLSLSSVCREPCPRLCPLILILVVLEAPRLPSGLSFGSSTLRAWEASSACRVRPLSCLFVSL